MEGTELANATYWAPLLETIADIAFAIVIVALAVELVSGRIAKRFERRIDASRELKIAELNNETARLKKQIGPRQIEAKAFLNELEGKPKAPVEIMYAREDSEAYTLSLAIWSLLKQATWEVSQPVPVPPGDVPRLASQPSVTSVGGAFVGVTIVVRADTNEEFEAFGREMPFGPGPDTALRVIQMAFSKGLGGVQATAAGPNVFHTPPKGTIRVVVGPKP